MNARDDNSEAPAGPRARAQRERILAAAQRCFIAHGFHAASMSQIADTAKMSAGLMYRYFPSKHAIVLAIIERQLDEQRKKIGDVCSSDDVASGVVRCIGQWRAGEPDAMNIGLLLSMSADAGRDPAIAQALAAGDRSMRVDLKEWLARRPSEGGRGLPEATLESRAILMQCVIEGLAMRAAREPELDVEALEPALRRLLDTLLAA